MIDDYARPPPTGVIHVGKVPYFDLSSRKGYFAPDEAAGFSIANANVDFHMKETPELVPAWVKRFERLGLNFLDFEAELAPSLVPVLPKVTYGIAIRGKASRKLRYDGPPCALVYAWLDATSVFFTSAEFPRLEFLQTRDGKSERLLELVRDSTTLRHLGVGSFDRAVIDAATGITSLQIAGSMDTQIALAPNPRIRELWLHSLRKLGSIAFIENLSGLTRLKLYYCRNDLDLAPLTRLPNLKSVEIVGAGSPGDLESCRRLIETGVEVTGAG